MTIVRATLAGVLLAAAQAVAVLAMVNLFPHSSLCGEYLGCLGLAMATWDVARWVALAAAWPLLHVLRVRPAWPVAVVGAVVLAGSWVLGSAVGVLWWLPGVSWLFGYPLAAALVRRVPVRRTGTP